MTAVAFGVLAAVGFACSTFLMQLGLKDARVSHWVALLINLTGACVLLVLAVPILEGLPKGTFTRTGALFFAASGLSASLGGQGAMFAAISRIGATRTACFVMADNLFAVILGFLALGQTISAVSGLGMIILMAGAVAFVQETRGNGNRQGTVAAYDRGQAAGGIGMAVLSALGYAGGGVLRGLGVAAFPAAMAGAAVSMLASFVLVLGTVALTGRLGELRRVPRGNALFLLLSGAAAAVGTVYFISALGHGGTVAVTTALKNLQPLFVFTLALAFLRRHERLSLRLGLLVSMVVGGGVLTALGRG